MILAHIMAHDRKQALEIINLLMDKKLLLQAAVSDKEMYEKKTANGELICEKMPMLYSVPIIYMDDELASLLRENTAKV